MSGKDQNLDLGGSSGSRRPRPDAPWRPGISNLYPARGSQAKPRAFAPAHEAAGRRLMRDAIRRPARELSRCLVA